MRYVITSSFLLAQLYSLNTYITSVDTMVSAIVYLFAFLKRLPIIQIIQDALLGAKRSKLAVCVRDDCLLEVTPNIVVL